MAGPAMYQSFFASIKNSLKKWRASLIGAMSSPSETKEEELNDGDEVGLPWPLRLPSSSSASLRERSGYL